MGEVQPRSHGAVLATRIRWTAGKDGVEHAHRGTRAIRTLCGTTAIQERFGYPRKSRCAACQAALAGEAR